MKRYIRSDARDDVNALQKRAHWYKKWCGATFKDIARAEQEIINALSGPNTPLIYVFWTHERDEEGNQVAALYVVTAAELTTTFLHRFRLFSVNGLSTSAMGYTSDLQSVLHAMISYNFNGGFYRNPSSDSSIGARNDDSSNLDKFSRDEVVTLIQDVLKVPKSIASIIYRWYANEDAYSDYTSLDDFADYLVDDIYDMIDACDDEDLRQRVLHALEHS